MSREEYQKWFNDQLKDPEFEEALYTPDDELTKMMKQKGLI